MILDTKTVFISALVLSLIFVQSLSSISYADTEAGTTLISSPVKQIKLGISPSDVKCKAGLELVFKATDASPACVSIFTKDILVLRGWAASEGFGAKVGEGGGPPVPEEVPTGGPKFVPNQLIIKFNDNIPDSEHATKLQGSGAEIVDSIPQIHVRILRVPDQALAGIMNSLQHIPGVEYVEQDAIYDSDAIPNDQYYANQKYLTKINAPAAWDLSAGSPNVLIAILDTGFDTAHPDLSSKFVNAYNAYDGTTNITPLSTCAHGTQVAGVAGATGNNNAGVSGVAWNNNIIPIKVTGTTSCSASTSALAKGVTYAADKGAKVANISFAIYAGDSTITTAAKYMYGKGGWVVAAAGNSGALVSSADNPYIISVGATDLNDAKASFSTYGPFVDIAAPGTTLYTTTLGGGYTYTSGTSVASPVVAGLVGLIFSKNPNLTPDQVYNVLKGSAADLGDPGRDNYFGWGRADAGKALASVPVL